MTDVNTDTGEPATHEAPVHNPDHYRPPAEPVKTYGPGTDGAREASRDLAERRAKPAPIKVWRDEEDDDLGNLSGHAATRKQASKLTLSRRMSDGERLMQATGARSGSAAEFVGATVRDKALNDEPVIREYADKDAQPNIRQAAKDLTQGRAADAPEAQARDEQFKQIVELLNGDEGLAREALGEQQTEQPAEPAPQAEQPDPVAQHRQHAAQYLQAAQQYAGMSQAEHLAAAQINQALAIHRNEFADVQSYEDAARMPADRQQRFLGQQRALRTAHEEFQKITEQRQVAQHKIESARAAEQQQAEQRFRAEQDEIIERDVAEMKDPVRRVELQGAMQKVVGDELGITRENYRNLHPVMQRALQDARVQKVLIKAAKYDMAQQRAHEVSAKPLPPVQRPGVSQPKGTRASAEAASLADRIDRFSPGSDKQIWAAARAIAAGRKARGR